MANPHGTPIWYELLSDDADASKAFYEAVIGWTIQPADPGGMDYRMIDAGRDGGGDFAGGLMQLTPELKQGGARPMWLFYIGVDDVDRAIEHVLAAGGAQQSPAIDLPGVGRMAMVADPQGNPFYVMRGASDEDSKAWSADAMGKCNWNELITSDQAAGNAFYAEVFGWSYPDKMEMPGMGDHAFVEAAGEMIGATMTAQGGEQGPGWHFYFRTPDIHAASDTIAASGGTVVQPPQEVPGGDMVLLAADPHGSTFGIVASRGG